MEYIDIIKNNSFFAICILFVVFCVIRGARKGMLRIIYGMISWLLLMVFVNIACGYISDYLNVNTPLPTMVQNNIVSNLHERYEKTEMEQEGSGEAAIITILPPSIQNTINETIDNSVDVFIDTVSTQLSESAIRGIATIISVLAGLLLLFILDKIIRLIGMLPGFSEVNTALGVVTGLIEGMLIIWFAMYLADCFPTSAYGSYIIENSTSNELLNYIYQINIIEQIIGI